MHEPMGEGRYVPEEYKAVPDETPEKPRDLNAELRELKVPVFPESEVDFTFARASGPGGQNVNKTSTKAVGRWHVGNSPTYAEAQKEAIRQKLRNDINKEDELVMDCDAERSQRQNESLVLLHMAEAVTAAVTPPKERKPTKPSRGAQQRRLDEKQRDSRKKQQRREGKKGEWE